MSANRKIKGPQNHPRSFFVPKIWQEREDSNPRPLVLETSALARLSYAPALYGAPSWDTGLNGWPCGPLSSGRY